MSLQLNASEPMELMPDKYSYNDILDSIMNVGIKEGDIVYVQSALWKFRNISNEMDLSFLPDYFFDAILEIIGSKGTVVVPTSSQNIMNTNESFDIDLTPSHERGIFSEFVRLKPEARRSFHPFSSYAAIGARASDIVENTTRQAYGPNSPEDRLINMDARILILGLDYNIITTTHHIEHVVGVPYRYNKEFMHPVLRDGRVNIEPFYQYVYYLNSDVEHGENKRIFDVIENYLDVKGSKLGHGMIYSYKMADFFNYAVEAFQENIYLWCKFDPKVRPWQI